MTQYVYDLQGNIIKEIDAYGYKSADTDKERYGTLYRYNMVGWLMEKRVPIDYNEGQVLYNVTVYTYDKVGNCISEQRSPDYVQEHEYPLTWHTLHYTYDLNHRLIKVKDTMGAVIEYAYDCLGNRILEKVKINETKTKTTHYRYNSVGWLERVSEEVDTEDIYKPTLYDISKNRVATIYEYDGNGNVIKATSPEGYITVYEYDQADRLIREGKSEDGKIYRNTGYTYDKAGNLTTQTNCNGYTVQYDYDLLSRRIRITDEEGGITRLFYDATGNIVKVVEPENYNAQTDDGVGTIYKYDNMNRLQVVKDAEGNMVQKNEYDARGELSLQKDAVGSGISYLRGIDGRIKEMITAGTHLTEL